MLGQNAGSPYRRAFLAVALLLGLVLQLTGVGPVRAAAGVNNLSIADASLNEPDAGTANMTFTVTLSPPAAGDVTVHYATSDGSAKAPGDYTARSGDLTFATGETSKTILVPVVGDTAAEANETFTVTLSSPTNASIADGTATGTIVNEDGPPPQLSVSDVAVTEGTGAPVSAVFTITLSPASTGNVTVHYATADGTATAPADYASTAGDFTFTPGQTSKTVSVPVVGDSNDEPVETFTLELSNADNAGVLDGSGTGTITDNDAAPTLSVNDVTVTEGNSGTTNATFTVTLSAASGNTVVVDYATTDGTASAPSDYTATGGSLTFTPGQTTRTFNVAVSGDTRDEANETFNVTLSNPTNATIADAQGVGTITDDDATPGLAINDVTVDEGNSGTAPATFTVTLSAPSNLPVTVHYATANGDAPAATAPSDYTSTSGDLTFAPGETSKTIAVSVVGDTTDEPNETFKVLLTAPTNATVTDGTGIGTITDDDGPPALSVSDASATEGNSGTSTATFTVTLAPASGSAVTVNYATSNGTATGGTDYEPASGTLTFAAGETTKTVAVTVYGDTVDEPNETFTMTLSAPSGATLADGTGTGTITDDDAGSVLSVNDASVTEGNSGTTNAAFTVTLSPTSAQTVTVHYATANGTATAGQDYTASSGDLTFAPGETTKTVNVPVTGDTAPEPNETFTLELSAPGNATIGDGSGTGTILNDDGTPPSISIADATVTEGNTGTVTATFNVTLSAASTQTVTVQYATANGTATAPADYATKSGTVTFAPGETTQPVTVTVAGDTLDEPNETFLVNLSAPVNATIADGQATGTITDDDNPPSLSVADVTVAEGNGGSTNANFAVTLSAASGQTVTVNYATANGTATAGTDYTNTAGSLTFDPGQTSKTVSVAVVGDTLDEPNETFTLTLNTPVNATIGDGSGTGTITDDDAAPTVSVNDVTVDEGNSGTSNATFTVTLSAASGQTVTVAYATSNGTATQPSDYASASGTLTFDPGQTSKTFNVVVNGDTLGEANETFNVTLSAPTNATIGDGAGTGTIANDDGAVAGFSVSDASIVEPDSGTANAVFTVTLSPASSQATSVHYATSNGTATAGTDYTSTAGDLTFAAGETSKTVSVPVTGDTADEPNETFTLTLSAPTNGAALTDATGTGTITNNDAATVPSRPVRVGAVGVDNKLWISNGYGAGFRSEGGVVKGAPALVRVPAPDNTVMLLEIVVGSDRRLWWQPEGGSGFTKLSNTALCDGSPAAVVTDDGAGGFTLTVACMGADRALWYDQGPITSTSVPVLDGWATLNGVLGAGPAVAIVQGTLTFLAPGPDGKIYTRTLATGYQFTPWACIGHPALASWGTTAYFACTGGDYGLWYARNTGSGWSGAVGLGGIAKGGPGLAVTPDEAVIFIRGNDNAVWQVSVSATRGNSAFSKLASTVVSEIGATVL
ncbi:MAG: large repetitive protein [Actinomycetota bacterium]